MTRSTATKSPLSTNLSSSAIDKLRQHPKHFGNAWIWTWDSWVGSVNATSELCRPLHRITFQLEPKFPKCYCFHLICLPCENLTKGSVCFNSNPIISRLFRFSAETETSWEILERKWTGTDRSRIRIPEKKIRRQLVPDTSLRAIAVGWVA